ncbi:unnamed protein product [Cladocopium goreaui]|uniref:Glycine transporter domain-containing protein n=1 Tax=Cladocopium goreaui TaxID=2562237 RepID=A0A9P1GPX8_9DINO|nr:unnamed protein product [Cladocopium goreaui]
MKGRKAQRQRLALIAALVCAVLLSDRERQAVTIDRTFMAANYVGDASFAFTGSLAAGLAGMDLLGCNLVGFITALGGGTIRDIMLGRTPIFWTTMYDEALLCIVISTGAFFGLPYLANRFGITAEGEFVFWTDTVGLAAFAVLGARVAACLPDHHVHAGACALCGLSTACFGGLVRDILCQKPPRILYAEHEMYATPALLGALVCVWLLRSGGAAWPWIFLSFSMGFPMVGESTSQQISLRVLYQTLRFPTIWGRKHPKTLPRRGPSMWRACSWVPGWSSSCAS